MIETPEHLIERLRTEGEKTKEFFCHLTPEQWNLTLYTDGACWTIRQLMAHFVATEKAFSQLIEDILKGGGGAPEDFNIDEFNESQVFSMQEIGTAELVQQFINCRQFSIELVMSMNQEDLMKAGRHPFLGVVPLEEIVKLLYRHNQIHQRDIRKVLPAAQE